MAGLGYYHGDVVHLVDGEETLCSLDVPDDVTPSSLDGDDPTETLAGLCGNCRRAYSGTYDGDAMATVYVAADTKDAIRAATSGASWTERLDALLEGEAVGVPDATERLGDGDRTTITLTESAKDRLADEKPDGVTWDYALRVLLEEAVGVGGA